MRRRLFDRSGSASDFEAWQASLAPAERSGAAAVARERAQSIDDPITGAQLLLALEDEAAAEALRVARHASVRGEEYYRVVPLAQTMEKQGRLLSVVVSYRALLTAISRGRTFAPMVMRPSTSPRCANSIFGWTAMALADARNIRGRVAQHARAESRVLEPATRLKRPHGRYWRPDDVRGD